MAGIITFLILTLIALGLWKFVNLFETKADTDSRGLRTGSVTKTPKRLFNKIALGAAALFTLLTVIFTLTSIIYKQEVGEASVIKSISGQVNQTPNASAGFALKAPWDERITYDILNQQAIFSLPANVRDDQKEFVKGGEITFTDADGVTANADVALRYSILPNKVVQTFERFGDQKAFEGKLVTQDVRSQVRIAPASYSTINVLTKRAEVEAKVVSLLNERWAKEGVQIESVALQDIRYPDSTKQKFTDAQNAQTQQTIATAELETTKISAQQKVVQAEADASANRILEASLTPNVLKQRELDTMRAIGEKGNTFFMGAGGATPLVQVTPTK